MEEILNTPLFNVMDNIDDDAQDMLMVLFQSKIITPSDTVEQALVKIDASGDEYLEGIMDHVMGSIVGNDSNDMPGVTVITIEEEAPHGERGSLGTFGGFIPEETNPAPEVMGISLQDLMDCGSEEDATELEWIVSRHFMKPSSDVTELIMKLNTIANPMMDSMGAQQDISVMDDDVAGVMQHSTGTMTPHQIKEYNSKMRGTEGLQLIERLLNHRDRPEKAKFISFLDGLKGNQDDELLSIVESGFKLIHKNS